MLTKVNGIDNILKSYTDRLHIHFLRADFWKFRNCQNRWAGHSFYKMAEVQPNTVFVGGVPEKIDMNEFGGLFGKFGELEQIRFPSAKIVMFKGKRTKVRRAFGFVQYKEEEGYKKALENSTVEFAGVTLALKAALPPRKYAKDTAFIVGIPSGTTEDMLKEKFAKYNVISVKIPRFNTDTNKGFAFVQFDSEEHFESALNANKEFELNGGQSKMFLARGPKKPWMRRGRFARKSKAAKPDDKANEEKPAEAKASRKKSNNRRRAPKPNATEGGKPAEAN